MTSWPRPPRAHALPRTRAGDSTRAAACPSGAAIMTMMSPSSSDAAGRAARIDADHRQPCPAPQAQRARSPARPAGCTSMPRTSSRRRPLPSRPASPAGSCAGPPRTNHDRTFSPGGATATTWVSATVRSRCAGRRSPRSRRWAQCRRLGRASSSDHVDQRARLELHVQLPGALGREVLAADAQVAARHPAGLRGSGRRSAAPG